MQLLLQKKALILSIIFFLAVMLAMLFLLRGVEKQTASAREALARWRAEDERKRSALAQADLMADLKPAEILLDEHFVRGSDMTVFLDSLEALGKTVKVQSEVSSVDVAPDGRALSVGLEAEGSFGNLYRFISLLENFPNLVAFESVDMERMSQGETAPAQSKGKTVSEKNPDWRASITLKLLSFYNN